MSSSPSGTDRVELDADGTVVVANEDSKRVVWPGPKNSERVRLTVGGRPVVENPASGRCIACLMPALGRGTRQAPSLRSTQKGARFGSSCVRGRSAIR